MQESNFIKTANILLDRMKKEPSLTLGMEFARLLISEIAIDAQKIDLDNVQDSEIVDVVGLGNSKMKSWYMDHPYLGGHLSAFQLFESTNSLLEVKFYHLSENATKKVIAGSVQLLPNWEDDAVLTRNSDWKVGIDLFLTSDSTSLLFVVSLEGKLRVLEFSERLSNTQVQIMEKLRGVGNFNSAESIHSALWNSLSLKEVSKEFYSGVSTLFEELRSQLVKNGRGDEDSKIYSSRLIGRLLFVWFLRKRGFFEGDQYFECESMSSEDYYEEKLKPLFFETLSIPINERKKSADTTTPYLNGGLFEIHENDWISEKIKFPGNFFSRLFLHFNQFNFTTDESSEDYEQIAIDPEMLGRVFESLLATQLTESGTTARKAMGAFYTPRDIVTFMCVESIRKYLYRELKDPIFFKGIDRLLDTPDASVAKAHSNFMRDLWGKDNAKVVVPKILDALRRVKIIDPACGSGAFPLGMVQVLVKVVERLDSEADPFETKIQLIRNSIYGVDIVPMAIEIAKLRTWLSIAVDAPNPREMKPLPNLDFKYICANSLIPMSKTDGLLDFGSDPELVENLRKIASEYFETDSPKLKKQLRERYQKQFKKPFMKHVDNQARQLEAFDPFDNKVPAEFFDSQLMFGISKFDIVITNPPYISTKGVEDQDKENLEKVYGFVDDLYSHFFFHSFNQLNEGGVLTFICSKTFWTIQSKKNLRELILNHHLDYLIDSSNPFDSALVDTCIITARKCSSDEESIYNVYAKGIDKSKEITFDQELFTRATNRVFFAPTSQNLLLFERLNQKMYSVMEQWWPHINTSKNMAKNRMPINDYLKNLKPGDMTLLGLLVDGGQGLATGNNGDFIAVLENTKQGKYVEITRVEKLTEYLISRKVVKFGKDKKSITLCLKNMKEKEIVSLIENIRKKEGKEVFGKGFLFRLIPENVIADVSTLSLKQREEGISGPKCFVPYDKGDKDGNSWILPTPFFINWSTESVRFLKENSGSKAANMPVVRNPQFYFKRGVCWILTLNESSEYFKARIREAGVFDVNAMSMFITNDLINEKFLVCVLNSYLVFEYKRAFVNGTSAFQINDARQLPIVLPNKQQIKEFDSIFDSGVKIKLAQYRGDKTDEVAEQELFDLQKILDQKVKSLYSIP